MLGFLALAQTVVTTHALKRTSDERRVVLTALRAVGEEVRSVADEAADTPEQWSQSIVDAVASGGRLGTNFTVRGLTPQAGETTVGTIEIVTDERRTDADLGVELGMPCDLNADGTATDANVSSDASLLPVVVTLRYTGLAGNRTVRRGFFLSRF